MPAWNDNEANLADREAAIRAELTASGGGATLASVLNIGNDAGGKGIQNLSDPVSPQDGATKAYVDSVDLGSVLAAGNNAGLLKIANLGTPTVSTDAATKGYVDSFTPATSNLATVLGVGNNAGALKITNLADPVSAQDAATKHYVDTASAVTPSLSSVLGVGASAGGVEITNLGTPVNSSDAATKGYVDIATFNNQAGTAYTLALSDLGATVNFTGASAATLTIPPNSSVAFPTFSVIYVCQGGAGQVTIAAGVGVTLVNPFSSFTTSAQYAEVKLTKIGTNTWRLNGEVT